MDARSDASTRAGTRDESEPGRGWLLFAAVMLGFAGTYNFIEGLLAIGRSHVFVGDARYVFSDLRTWGWIVLVLGALQLFATWKLYEGSEFARWVGIAAAGLNAIGQLLFVQAYPFWALALFACDVLVIYALATHAGSKLRRYEL
jgi:hypothetical protein